MTFKSSWCPQGPHGVPEVPKGVSNASRVVTNVPKVSQSVAPQILAISELSIQQEQNAVMLTPSMFPVYCSMEGKQERHIHPTGASCTHPGFVRNFFAYGS